jgi:hypothetical protein
MSVGAYALTSLAEAQSYIGGTGQANGIWLYCSAADATAATAQVNAATLVLIITGGTSAGTSTLTFADANKDTITELVTAINAVPGWTAGAIYNGSAASTDLVVTGAVSCLGAANELTLKIEDNYKLEKLIDRATDYIERYCNRKLYTRSYSREAYRGTGYPRLLLDNYPVTAVSRLSYGRKNAFSITNTTATNNATAEITSTAIKLSADGAAATSLAFADYATLTLIIAAINALSGWTATLPDSSLGARKSTDLLVRPAMHCLSVTVCYAELPDDDLTDYFVVDPTEDRNYGAIEVVGGFQRGEEYFIDYTAGYTTIPAALEEACLELVKFKYEQLKHDRNLRSESLGDYSYTIADFKSALPDDMREAIDAFRRRVF